MDIDTSKLKGNYVFLELLSESHREAIRLIAKDERIWEFNKLLPIDENYDAMYDAYFDTALDKMKMGGQQAFVMRKVKDGSIIGMTRLYEINPKDKHAMIGYTWYIPSVWGKVYNKESKFLLLRYIFETLAFNRAELRAVGQNIRSQKAIEKIGGTREGVLRKHGYRSDGVIKDTVIYGIIDDDWKCVKEKLMQLIADGEND
ncbi:MAG TPA: GNAT family protein [Chitinophagaceae bacterium]|nr:GNAT family protein [Chitinophagaceae bacterium]